MTTDRKPTLLDDIYAGEVEDITFPCTRSLKAGETVADAVVTVAWFGGLADAAAAAVGSTPRVISGADVVQRVAGHQAGTWYRIDALVTLSSGRKLVGQGIFYSKPRGLS